MTVTAITTSEITSATTTLDFTLSGATAAYDEILLTWTGVKGGVDEKILGFQVVTSGGSLDRPIQSTAHSEWHYAHDYSKGQHYDASRDKNYDATYKFHALTEGGDTHKSYSATNGQIRFFKHSDTDFYTFFQINSNVFEAHLSDFQQITFNWKCAGYVRDTAALTSFRFQYITYNGNLTGAGDIAKGTFSLYGIS